MICKGYGRKRSWPNLTTIPALVCREWGKARNLSRNRLFSCRDLNPRPHEHEAGMLTTRPRHSVSRLKLPTYVVSVLKACKWRISRLLTVKDGWSQCRQWVTKAVTDGWTDADLNLPGYVTFLTVGGVSHSTDYELATYVNREGRVVFV
jgi:hypothetical protein